MNDIYTDRAYHTLAEDAIYEALFPELSLIDLFGLRYPTACRFPGEEDFALTAFPDSNEMIRWACLATRGPEPWTTGLYRVDMDCEIVVAIRGRKSVGSDVVTTARQQAVTDCGLIREALRKQFVDSRLTAGPFGIKDTDEVGGQGTGPQTHILEVEFGSTTVRRTTAAGDPNNLGSHVWMGTVPVTITVDAA